MSNNRHPLLNQRVDIEWADENDRPTTGFVAYVGDGFVRFVDTIKWADATWDEWVPLEEIIGLRVVKKHESR